MKTVQQACLANLLGLPQESATDGGLKPSPLIFFIVWGLEAPDQGGSMADSGEGSTASLQMSAFLLCPRSSGDWVVGR